MSDRNIKGGILWKIENFGSCGHSKGEPVISPVFSLVTQYDTYWRLFLYPRGKSNDQYVSCYLEYHEENIVRVKSVSFGIYILTRESKIHHACRGLSVFVRPGRRFGFNHFCKRESFLDAKESVMPKDILSISCHLTVDIKDEDKEEENNMTLKELSQNFRILFQSGEFSDMTLCVPGEDYKVHQVLISARAPYLADELGLNKNKNLPHPVKFNNISPPVLKELLVYLYSGQVESKDGDILAGLYEVAQRYNLKRLKRHIFPGPAQCSARTRIKVIRKSILWCINDFNKRKMGQGLPANMFVDMGIIRLVLTCCVAENDDSINVFVRRVCPRKTQKIYFRSKITVKRALKNSEACQDFECWFEKSNSDSQFLILTMKRKVIFSNSVDSPNDELQISLNFVASNDKQRSRIENSNCLWTSAIEETMQYLSLYELKEDLKSLWNSLDFTDLQVKVKGGEEIMVHKAILSVRSPVFQVLLQEDLPNNASCLNFEDMELEIAWEMLKYLYRGEVHADTFDDYVKLYIAAVRFKIFSLLKRCVHYLVINVTEKSVCELLTLGDKFGDEIMLISAQEFISAKRHTVLKSNEWKQLVKEHPNLASKLLLWLSTQFISNV